MTSAGQGRPVRFLALVLGGWTALRVTTAFVPWPIATADVEPGAGVALPALASASHAPGSELIALPIGGRDPHATNLAPQEVTAMAPRRWSVPAPTASSPSNVARHVPIAGSGVEPPSPWVAGPGLVDARQRPSIGADVPIISGLPIAAPARTRWSGSFWLFARGGGGIAAGTIGGQLGGSQAGARLAYLLDRRRRVSLVARVAAPLGSGLSEAAAAVEWQPTRFPIRLLVEQRVAIHGGRGGPGAGIVGGFGPAPIGAGFRLEGYGEAGVIRRAGTEPYADGALRLARRVAGGDRLHLDLGAGAWGGAQRGAERLDLGPPASLGLPIGPVPARLSLDWRERVAGHARPASGPALTLGADF